MVWHYNVAQSAAVCRAARRRTCLSSSVVAEQEVRCFVCGAHLLLDVCEGQSSETGL